MHLIVIVAVAGLFVVLDRLLGPRNTEAFWAVARWMNRRPIWLRSLIIGVVWAIMWLFIGLASGIALAGCLTVSLSTGGLYAVVLAVLQYRAARRGAEG